MYATLILKQSDFCVLANGKHKEHYFFNIDAKTLDGIAELKSALENASYNIQQGVNLYYLLNSSSYQLAELEEKVSELNSFLAKSNQQIGRLELLIYDDSEKMTTEQNREISRQFNRDSERLNQIFDHLFIFRRLDSRGYQISDFAYQSIVKKLIFSKNFKLHFDSRTSSNHFMIVGLDYFEIDEKLYITSAKKDIRSLLQADLRQSETLKTCQQQLQKILATVNIDRNYIEEIFKGISGVIKKSNNDSNLKGAALEQAIYGDSIAYKFSYQPLKVEFSQLLEIAEELQYVESLLQLEQIVAAEKLAIEERLKHNIESISDYGDQFETVKHYYLEQKLNDINLKRKLELLNNLSLELEKIKSNKLTMPYAQLVEVEAEVQFDEVASDFIKTAVAEYRCQQNPAVLDAAIRQVVDYYRFASHNNTNYSDTLYFSSYKSSYRPSRQLITKRIGELVICFGFDFDCQYNHIIENNGGG